MSFSVLYLCESSSNAIKCCTMPSSVSCSDFTRIFTGFLKKLETRACSSSGIVALKRHTCTLEFRKLKILYTCSLNPTDNISSASSSTIIFTSLPRMWFLRMMSCTRPGHPTITCGVSFFKADTS